MNVKEKIMEFIEKARDDAELKKALISDFKGTLKEKAGIELSDDMEINLTEKDFDADRFTVEELLKKEINDSALDEVAGGYWGEEKDY